GRRTGTDAVRGDTCPLQGSRAARRCHRAPPRRAVRSPAPARRPAARDRLGRAADPADRQARRVRLPAQDRSLASHGPAPPHGGGHDEGPEERTRAAVDKAYADQSADAQPQVDEAALPLPRAPTEFSTLRT